MATVVAVTHPDSGPFKAPSNTSFNTFMNQSGSVVLQATTDVRSHKVRELRSNAAAEVLWWFPKSKVQFRLSSRAYILPSLSHQWRREFPTDWAGEAGGGGGVEVDWEATRMKCFNELSSFLRASFAREPTPGTELKHPEQARKWPNELPRIGDCDDQEEVKALVEAALDNFAVLYLDVDEVDLVDLSVVPNERFLFRKCASQWIKTALVP